MFKPRAKKDKPTRKRPAEGDDDDGDAELTLEELRELKEDQKFRERKRLQGDKNNRKSDAAPTSSAASEGSLTTLNAQFMIQSAEKPIDPFEVIKNKYIEDKLKEKYTPTVTTTAPALSKERTEELELYSIPDHLRHKPTEQTASKQQDGVVLARNASVPEIDLPSTDPTKALQATHVALAAKLHNQHSTGGSSSLPANVSANYAQHKADHIKNKHASKKDGASVDQERDLAGFRQNRVSSAS